MSIKVGVIVNEGKELGSGLEALRAELAHLGHPDPPWYEVPKSKKAPSKVMKMVEKDGIDRLLVWGGDGTVRRCIDTLLTEERSEVALGILPAGTGNLLAKNLGVPIDLRGAVKTAVEGEPRPVDVGVMNGQHFAVMAGAGFDAMLIKDADDSGAKDRFGRLGYIWAGLRNTKIRPAETKVTIDGHDWYTGDATSVIVANVGTVLGGLEAFPAASPTDGRLDVGVIKAKTGGEWMRLATRTVVHRADFSPLAEVISAETVTFEFDRTLPWEADGGERERSDSFEVECLPGAIRICQPWAVQ